MTRMHVHVGVDDLAASIRFYSNLFGAGPAVERPDYAKWMLADPKLNFAISVGHAARGIEHLGLEAETPDELAAISGRLASADAPVLDEGATTCCYAQSTKAWVADPQGVVWETFHTSALADSYGNSPALDRLRGETAAETSCCALRLAPAKSGCC